VRSELAPAAIIEVNHDVLRVGFQHRSGTEGRMLDSLTWFPVVHLLTSQF